MSNQENMQAIIAKGKTIAKGVTAGLSRAALGELTDSISTRNIALRTDINKAVQVAMAYLVESGTIEPVNKLLAALNTSDAINLQHLIHNVTVYQLVDLKAESEDSKLLTLAKGEGQATAESAAVQGKIKGSKAKQTEIEARAMALYARFMDDKEGFNGDFFKWIEAKDSEVKNEMRNRRRLTREANEAKKPDMQKGTDAIKKFTTAVNGVAFFDAEFKEELNNKIQQMITEYTANKMSGQI